MNARVSHVASRWVAALLASLLLAACAHVPIEPLPFSERDAIAARLTADIATLASDEFEGRKPGTPGEARTLAYLEQRMAEIGLVSGTNDPGSYWRAPVDLVASRPQSSRITFGSPRRVQVLAEAEAAAFTPRRRALATGGPQTGAPVVFAGTVPERVPPEFVAGAVMVIIGQPGISPAQREALYRQRATAVITVLTSESAIAQARAGYARERVLLASEEVDTLSAFVTDAVMARTLGAARWAALKARAEEAEFAGEELDLPVTIEASSDRREFASHNLIGLIPGRLPGSGAVLLLAHWDHLGECGPPDAADRICNGAVDNASGIAVMLELAQRLKAGPPLDRDIYVLATSAEEAGLLGAKAFVANPPMPLPGILAAFNFDTVAIAPAGKPLGFIGQGRTPLDPLVTAALARSGRVLGDPAFADSFLQRQDGWALLEQGVPAVLLSSAFASNAVLGPFLEQHYHRASDAPGVIELGGAIDDLLLHEELVREVADAARYQPAARP